jgi:SPP1 gp7 family putative phage head morphogenesis protein
MAEIPDLGYATSLAPDAAIRYFEAKGYRVGWRWQDTWQEAHARAFTVAKVTRLDVLNDIRSAVQQALKEGKTEKWFEQQLTPVLQAKGWWGRQIVVGAGGGAEVAQLGSPQRLRTIYRTNMQTAYMAGRFEQFARNVDERPYWQYVAVMDLKTRPAHAAMNGRVFRYDDPIWKYWWPPCGFNCRCRVRALSQADLKRRKLTAETSEGRLRSKRVNAGFDPRTGEVLQTEVHGLRVIGPDGKPMTVFTDAGWDYNPGRASFIPNLDNFPPDTARQFVEGLVTGPEFKRWFEIWQHAVDDAVRAAPKASPREIGALLARRGTGGVSGMEYPVAVLREPDREALKTESQTVLLSTGTLIEHLAAHPEIGLADYQLVPQLLDRGEVYADGDTRVVLLAESGKLYQAVIKVDSGRRRLYLLTLFRIKQAVAEKVRSQLKRIR